MFHFRKLTCHIESTWIDRILLCAYVCASVGVNSFHNFISSCRLHLNFLFQHLQPHSMRCSVHVSVVCTSNCVGTSAKVNVFRRYFLSEFYIQSTYSTRHLVLTHIHTQPHSVWTKAYTLTRISNEFTNDFVHFIKPFIPFIILWIIQKLHSLFQSNTLTFYSTLYLATFTSTLDSLVNLKPKSYRHCECMVSLYVRSACFIA